MTFLRPFSVFRYLQNIKSNNLPTPVSGRGSAGNGGQHHVNYTDLVAPYCWLGL